MECEDWSNEDHIFEETEEAGGGEEEEEVEEGDDDGGGEEGEDDEELEEEVGEELSARFKGMINLLDLFKDNSHVQLYQQFERIENEALAEKKRKALAAGQGKGLVKRPRQESTFGATSEELVEVYEYGNGRRRSRKPKKRGRRKGSRNKLSPEITKKLGDANLHYAHGRYEDAISLLTEVIRLAPNLPDPYHTLGLIYNSVGDKKKSVDCYMIAAFVGPKDSSLWKLLVTWSIELEDKDQTWYCIKKAIAVDPTDITLWYQRASYFMGLQKYSKAAESYDRIVQICPDNVEALKAAATLYKRSGLFERSIVILEDYVNKYSSEADLTVVDMLVLSFMESKIYTKALQCIELAKSFGFKKEFPLCLRVREGICHVHLGNIEKAEICFSPLQRENAEAQLDLIMEVANSYAGLHQPESALNYYLMLEDCISKNKLVSLKIAHCFLALRKTTSAIHFFYKALQECEDDIDARLTLASLLLEENREDEAIELLSPPPKAVLSKGTIVDNLDPWWLNVKIKLKLAHIYKTKEMLEAFVEVIYPIIHESLKIDSMHQKAKQKRRLSMSELSERVKVLVDTRSDSVFGNFRKPASKHDLLKANRAKKLIEKRVSSKEEKISAAMAAGLDWESDDSEDEVLQQPLKEPPLPDLFKDEEHYDLISDLCIALTSLRRYSDALELKKLTLKITYKILPAERKDKFQSLGAQIALNVTDPSDGFDYVRYIVQQRPQSITAWNFYYRHCIVFIQSFLKVLRLENRLSKHNKFLHHMRVEQKDLVPPMIISGNQFTMISQHQVAAREYLEAYKQMPDSPLVNLCAGTALINLSLGHRLQNKHQCLSQGSALLYNNLELCENSQEALYNIARAYHHVGLVSLAATYYEKVLAIPQEDRPLPKLIKVDKDPRKGFCDLRREAAYNLHLIYKRSGAIDLARQVLRDYCTV